MDKLYYRNKYKNIYKTNTDHETMRNTYTYSVSSLVVPKMEEEFAGTGTVKNSKWPDKSW